MKKEEIILKPCVNNICGKSYNLLNIKLLNGCNGKCTFCIAAGTPYRKSAEAKKFIDTANSMEKFSKVDVLGGEPTLYPDLVEVLKGIRPYKKEINIISNGSNLEVIKECLPYLDTITLSIHSFDYNKNSTGIVIDEKVLKKINKNKGNVETIAAVVITKETVSNLKEIKEYAKKAKKLGFSAIKLMELVTSNENIDFIDLQDLLVEFKIHQKDTLQYGCYLEPKSLEKKFGIKIILNLTCNLKSPIKQPQYQSLTYEPMCFDSIYISPDGSIHKSFVSELDLANERGAC